MKTVPLHLLVLIGGLGLPVYTYGQGAEEEVLSVMEEVRQAVQECRMEEYASYWDEEATIFTTGGTGLWPISKYLEIWRGVCAAGGGISFESDQPKIWVTGDAALVISTVNFSFTGADSTTISGSNRFTTVLRKTNKGWKLLHAHGSDLLPTEKR